MHVHVLLIIYLWKGFTFIFQGNNAKFTYKLLNASVPVQIDGNTGIIRVKNQSAFDRETYREGIKLMVCYHFLYKFSLTFKINVQIQIFTKLAIGW